MESDKVSVVRYSKDAYQRDRLRIRVHSEKEIREKEGNHNSCHYPGNIYDIHNAAGRG